MYIMHILHIHFFLLFPLFSLYRTTAFEWLHFSGIFLENTLLNTHGPQFNALTTAPQTFPCCQ
uniref:Uncharacterized protein n=1 Tax=Anguilla anguilla TaxID=7936 RepID=A0A0E9RAV0_ANGAN